ncbi:acyl carrier protein [Thalassotalea maritima]|uniref:acyl carrier protein n=1 Tax=Thalassotalea maritima TaxID=3242416 RepID=UPI0035292B60
MQSQIIQLVKVALPTYSDALWGFDTPILGALPEFDSMAVVTVLTAIEEEFGIFIADDELSAEVFETIGSLTRFVEAKVG